MNVSTNIHDEIESWLAADAHEQLSRDERDALHQHLVECAACRQLHREDKNMHKLLEENLAPAKADPTFEQRMLASFRRRVPDRRGGVAAFLLNALRLRATQVAAVAVVLLALVQTGRMITRENSGQELRANHDRAVSAPSRDLTQNQILSAALAKTARPEKSESKAGFAGAQGRVDLPAPPPAAPEEDRLAESNEVLSPTLQPHRDLVDGSAAPVDNQRKLVRSAQVELEIASFEETVQKIAALTKANGGYIATSNSQKQANGKLHGEVVTRVLPEKLDAFLPAIRALGELKNQSLGAEDVTKAYFDTDARLKNARVMEQRLLEMLKTKTGKVSDLLEVEKELSRVREEIEKMQGELKFWDSQVQFATVTISLAEKDLEEPAAFLLKERAQLALYSPEVEAVYHQIKALASATMQIANAQLDHDNLGHISARLRLLLAPEASDGVIAKIKSLGRVENFQVETERVAQGGEGLSANAVTKRDKVELNITLSREEQEQALQQTTLQIRTGEVEKRTAELRSLVEKFGGRVRGSSFSRDPNGQENASLELRLPMKNYDALVRDLDSLGKVQNVGVHRQDRTGNETDLANAPADLSIVIYSQGNIVSSETGLVATLRRTIAQGAGALMWSLRMIGVAIAFLAPWALALALVVWVIARIARRRRGKE